MARTAQIPDLHTLAGARWLAKFIAVVLLTLIGALVMIVYPYVST